MCQHLVECLEIAAIPIDAGLKPDFLMELLLALNLRAVEDERKRHNAHILNTPNRGASGIGASRHAASASPSTSRVCTGSITPSSHSRAVA